MEKKEEDSLTYTYVFSWVNRTPILLFYALFGPFEIFGWRLFHCINQTVGCFVLFVRRPRDFSTGLIHLTI